MAIPYAIRMKLKGAWTARRATTINSQRIRVPVNMRLDVPNVLVPMTERVRLLPMTTMKMGFAIRTRSVVVRIQMHATTTLMRRMTVLIANIPLVATVAQVHPTDRV